MKKQKKKLSSQKIINQNKTTKVIFKDLNIF